MLEGDMHWERFSWGKENQFHYSFPCWCGSCWTQHWIVEIWLKRAHLWILARQPGITFIKFAVIMMWKVDEIVCVPMGMLVMTKASRQEAFFFEEGKRTNKVRPAHSTRRTHSWDGVAHTNRQTNERTQQIDIINETNNQKCWACALKQQTRHLK